MPPTQQTMHTTLKKLLNKTDWDWKLGKLLDARAGYRKALEIDLKCWPALVQLIWFDAAFGQVKSEDMERLETMDLPEHADRFLKHLRFRLKMQQEKEDWGDSSFVLDGELEDWDIGQLKLSAKESADRWEAFAQCAYDANLEGLAWACYIEAEELAPEMYYDPPTQVGGAQIRALRHIDMLNGKAD